MSERRLDLACGVLGAAGAVFVLTIALVAFFQWNNAVPDVTAYWQAALRLRHGEPLYVPPPPGPSPKAFLYPPVFAALFAPLTYLEPIWGYALWMALHFAFLAGLAAAAARAAGARVGARLACLFTLWLLPAVAGDLQEGQVNLFVSMCIATALLLAERGGERSAGVLLGLAAHVKLQPLVLLPVLLLQRRLRTAAWTCAAVLLLPVLPALWLPPGDSGGVSRSLALHADFVRTIVTPALGQGMVAGSEQFYLLNGSFAGILHRLFGQDVAFSPLPDFAHLRGPVLFALPRAALFAGALAAGGVLLCLGFWAALRRQHSAAERFAAPALVFVAAQMSSLTFWEHHAVSAALLLVPLAAWAQGERRLRAPLLAATFACVTFWTGPFVVEYFSLFVGRPSDLPWLRTSRTWGLPTLALLALWGTAWHALRTRERQSA